ncbi:hypothetical protein G6011_08611 [Alternaria panax]|uniref:BTB domain-containing protein n=1 Tax=Alternaria panax TaxID=48097 RepID=A0AAD4FI80_9PLEO|nr:hypothetical protein G6011_08611 [Alternaria panax]
MSSSSDAVLLPSMAAGSEIIIVTVGAEGKEYHLHTSLLMHYSGYFRGALSGAFKETDEGVVSLLDIDTDAFDVFVDWLYRGTLRSDLEYVRLNPSSGLATACRAYVLADRLLVPSLKSALMDGYFDKNMRALDKWYPSCRRIIHAFENLAENDPLLRLYVDWWAFNHIVYKMDGYDRVLVPELPPTFLVRLVGKMNDEGKKSLSRSRLKRKDYDEATTADRKEEY